MIRQSLICSALALAALGTYAPQALAEGERLKLPRAPVFPAPMPPGRASPLADQLLVPDYLGHTLRALQGTQTTATINLGDCKPNSVVQVRSTVAVVCHLEGDPSVATNNFIAVYDAAALKQSGTPSPQRRITGSQFQHLIGSAVAPDGGYWVASYGSWDTNDTTGALLKVDLSSGTVVHRVINSPAHPAALTFTADAAYVVGQYQGGVVVKLALADLNSQSDVTPLAFAKDGVGFDNPEGVAVFKGAVFVGNNGGDHATHQILRFDSNLGNATKVLDASNKQVMCPGGFYAAGNSLYVNDQSYDLLAAGRSGCGNGDAKASAGAVLVYTDINLQNPKVIPAVSSRPGFGGLWASSLIVPVKR